MLVGRQPVEHRELYQKTIPGTSAPRITIFVLLRLDDPESHHNTIPGISAPRMTGLKRSDSRTSCKNTISGTLTTRIFEIGTNS
eukprot:6872775-Pyramimonas_sp.AAC.1